MTGQPAPPPLPNTGVPSPCIGVCELDAARVCIGCRRTLAEIAEWGQAGDARRLEILKALRSR